jgi:hypothetical protein
MKRVWVLLLLCASAAAQAQDAGSPEAMRAAQDLAAIVTGDTIDQMSRSMTAQMWPRIESQFGGKVDSATLGELRGEFQTALTSFTTDTMKDAPAIYAKYFSVAELRDLLAFYKTPTGAKALKTMPLVTADITGHMMPHLQPFQADLVGRLQAVMQRHGYKD